MPKSRKIENLKANVEIEDRPDDDWIAQHIDTSLADLERLGVVLPKPAKIRTFLSTHHEMPEALARVGSKLAAVFRGDAQLTLEYYQSFEEQDAYLAFYVRQWNYSEDLIDRIESIRSELHEEITATGDDLHITTDFRRPR